LNHCWFNAFIFINTFRWNHFDSWRKSQSVDNQMRMKCISC
jgi:ribosomal protein L32E